MKDFTKKDYNLILHGLFDYHSRTFNEVMVKGISEEEVITLKKRMNKIMKLTEKIEKIK